MRERAAEILKYEKAAGHENPTIAIVDEYRVEGRTVEEIERAFGYRIPNYAVANVDYGAYGEWGKDQKRYREPESDYLWPASINPKNGYGRFSYFGMDAVGVEKDRNDGEKYSYPIKTIGKNDLQYLHETKKQLRDEMKAVGEKIAGTLEIPDHEIPVQKETPRKARSPLDRFVKWLLAK